MEAFGTILVYVILPFIGFVILIIGVVRFAKKKLFVMIILCSILLLIPFLHKYSTTFFFEKLEKEITGNYFIKNSKILAFRLTSNQEFSCDTIPNTNIKGTGTWDIKHADELYLELTFEESFGVIMFLIDRGDDKIILTKPDQNLFFVRR